MAKQPEYTMAKQPHELTPEEAGELTKKQLRAIFETPGYLAHFNDRNLDLLEAIDERGKVFIKAKDKGMRQLYDKINWMKNKKPANFGRRQRYMLKKTAFPRKYSREKFEKWKLTISDWNATLLLLHSGKVQQQSMDLPAAGGDVEEGTSKVKEQGLFYAELMGNLNNQQKNDTVAIMGQSFGRGDFCHDTAYVTHRILTEIPECFVMLIKYAPADTKGKVLSLFTVGAALFVPARTLRHRKGKDPTKVQQGLLRAVNLVQVGVIPKWGGRNLGRIAVEVAVKERLQALGFDFMFLCGCHEDYYKTMGFPFNPKWLLESPFKINPPDKRTKEVYNRQTFFYQTLSSKVEANIIAKYPIQKFSFVFEAEVMQQYYTEKDVVELWVDEGGSDTDSSEEGASEDADSSDENTPRSANK